MESDSDSDDDDDMMAEVGNQKTKTLHVLPLYALLSTEQQMKIFQDPPPKSRLCVIATNVAETSLTIPNIKYVIDTGRVKERKYDFETSTTSFEVTWTSQASAEQRAGRAGRTGPGHCYRLYSSALFANEFEKYSTAEIQRMPIESTVLQMKSMNIDNVTHFPFPSAPSQDQLLAAETLLVRLSALDGESKRITEIGQMMALLPMAPRQSRMVVAALSSDHLIYVILMAAIFTVGDPFETQYQPLDNDDQDDAILSRQFVHVSHVFADGTGSDIVTICRIYGAYEHAEAPETFCRIHKVRVKAMREIKQLVSQLSTILRQNFPSVSSVLPPSHQKLQPFNAKQMKQMHQSLLIGFVDHVACRVREFADGSKPTRPTYRPLSPAIKLYSSDMKSSGYYMQIHPSSVINKMAPEFVIFNLITMSGSGRRYMSNVTVLSNKSSLSTHGKQMCTFSAPLEHPSPYYDGDAGKIMCYATPTFGGDCSSADGIKLDVCTMEYPASAQQSRLLARAFIEGQMFHGMKQWSVDSSSSTGLLSNPSVPLYHPKVAAVVQPLLSRKVRCRQDLVEVWKESPLFLLEVYLQWVPTSLHGTVKSAWPPTE